MDVLRTLTRLPRWLMLAALLCILVARVAVPSGWMPMLGADGGLILAPCSGMGAVAMGDGASAGHMMAGHMMAGHAMDHDDHHDGRPQGDHPCSGAGVSAGLETPIIAAPLPLAATHVVTLVRRLATSVGRGLAAPPPPSTGPPAFV